MDLAQFASVHPGPFRVSTKEVHHRMTDESGPSLIQLQPRSHHFHVSQGRTVLTTSLSGFIENQGMEGLWVLETRLLSRYIWKVGGSQPTFSVQSAVDQQRSIGYYIFAPPECSRKQEPGCDPAQNSVEIKIDRTVGEGLLEHITLTNHTLLKTSFTLALDVGADFAGASEATGPRMQKGRLTKQWRCGDRGCTLAFDYKARHAYSHQGETGTAIFHRGIRLLVVNDQRQPEWDRGQIRFRIKLKPRQEWHATLAWTALVDGLDLPLPNDAERQRKRTASLADAARYKIPGERSLAPVVIGTIRRAAADIAALRMYDLDGEDALGEHWVPAAGVPLYVGLFSRDVLFTSRQFAAISTAMLRGSLSILAGQLGTEINDWRDEQPGRVIHEIHSGPPAQLNYTPLGRDFGGATGSFFYGSAAADLWRWTGNKELVTRFIEPALRTLEWADRYCRDKSGFYKYRTRSKRGVKNQGWKDSADAIVYPNGSQVPDPLGTCEMQGCVYSSKQALSQVLWAFGDKDTARRLAKEAEELKTRFNDFFWMRKENYIAMGIDGKNRRIESITSDPGLCLRYGIVADQRREAVVRRLMADDLFSGWGVRTLSSKHPSFNPFSYHCGSVWPIENGELVMALAMCGMVDEMHRLARAMFEAAKLFPHCRLPEVFSGHARDAAHPFPALYPNTNTPQAWSASAPYLVLQAMLGIQPYAPLELLLLDPHLPEWLPEIALHRLRVGDARISLRFRREASGRTEYEVIETEGSLTVARRENPWALVTGPGEKAHSELYRLKQAA